jgi:hypothetical protein
MRPARAVKTWIVLYDAATNDRVETGKADIRPAPIRHDPCP